MAAERGKKGKGKGKVDDYYSEPESEEGQVHTPSSTQLDRIEAMLVQLVRRERIAEVKGEIAARSLTRLEEDTPVDDEAKDLEDAVQHRRVMRCKVDKWLIDRGFGFAMAQGQTVFVHASVVRKAEFLRKDSLVMLKIVADPSREGTQFKAVEAWSLPDWQLESAARLAQESADRARRAAEITARASEQVQYRLQAVRLATPPGLDGMFLDPGPGAEAKKKAQEKEAQLKVPAQVYWDRIVKIYQKHDVAMPPDKIKKMMPNYKGKEHILYNKVCRKFKEVQLKVPLATAAPEIGAGGGFGIAAGGATTSVVRRLKAPAAAALTAASSAPRLPAAVAAGCSWMARGLAVEVAVSSEASRWRRY